MSLRKKRYLVIPNSKTSSDLEIRTKSLFYAWILYRVKYKKKAIVWDAHGWVDQSEYRPWLHCGYPDNYPRIR
ncbi:hypothetical protein A7M79_00245 [Acinetobacter baumannii]|nr:hypothetical protein A7M79_00245 [Acinetobacter baumannii]